MMIDNNDRWEKLVIVGCIDRPYERKKKIEKLKRLWIVKYFFINLLKYYE